VKNTLLLIPFILLLSPHIPVCRLSADQTAAPSWLDRSIYSEDGFIFSVGRSGDCKTEAEAKSEALSAATEAFVRYCRVDVQCFDRSIELYSKLNGKSYQSADLSAGRQVRAAAFVSGSMPQDWYFSRDASFFRAAVLLKIPQGEFERISRENNIRLSADILFYSEDAGGKLRVMDENSVLSSGDGFAIYVNPSDPCYVYVFQIDSTGRSFRLFPNTEYETGANPVLPATGAWLPNDRKLYEMDETTGKEYVYVFAAREPIKELEGPAAANFTKSGLDEIVLIKKMGIARLKDKRDPSVIAPRRTSDIREVKKKLQAEGDFVYETWFWHK
jgi:hypothetical protein